MILVCDDGLAGPLLCAELRAWGWGASLAPTAHDAVAALGALIPDAVVLDLHLPGASPAEVVAQVRAVYAGPVVIATGDEIAAHALAVRHGCAVLAKPHTTAALVATLQRLTPPARPSGR